MKWLCRECDGQTGNDYVQPPQRRQVACEKCGNLALCHLCYEEGDKRPGKRRKKRLPYHPKTIRLPKKTFKELKAEAKKVGCSVHSLILNYVDKGLHPPLIQTQAGYIPAPVSRPPPVGLPPGRKIKKGEKDPLVAAVEAHPLFLKQKKKYG